MRVFGWAATVAVAGLFLAGNPAQADTVNATLGATYYRVVTDPDFEGVFSTPSVAAGSSLGLNGQPVASGGVNDINGVTGEITWWSPTLNTNVVQTGVGTISLPYGSNMYAPNSTGGGDGGQNGFETAVFTGLFNLANPGTVDFQLGSDDDSFIYVDGTLFGQNPGVHGVTNVTFTSPTLSAGAHTLKVFYADRHTVGAYLSLNLLSTDVVITPPAGGVPEPATWAMMLVGLGSLGGLLRSRRRTAAAAA